MIEKKRRRIEVEEEEELFENHIQRMNVYGCLNRRI